MGLNKTITASIITLKEYTMFQFLKRLFGFKNKQEDNKVDLVKRSREHVIDHDMIDYDGMGNQGRFPMHK